MNTISSKVKKVKVLTFFKNSQTKKEPPKTAAKAAVPAPAPSVASASVNNATPVKKPVPEKKAVVAPVVAPTPVVVEEKKARTSDVCIIAGDAEIRGSITSKTDIKVEGKVYGNITGEMNIYVKGTVEGDISGKSVTVEQGSIVGNIKSLSSVLISDNSVIEGDVKCAQFDHNGSVKGNVQADTMAILKNSAVLKGDLNSQYLSIMDGAVICGVVSIDRSQEKKASVASAK